VPEAVKSERLAALQAALIAGQERFNQASVGTTVPVLLDRPGRRPGQLQGRSPHMQSVHVKAPAHLIGRIVPVHIETAKALSLGGRLALEEGNQRLEVA
jgi:tRNA-2-methylthio-N6-dimethylallyladenosine synthase